MELQTTNCMACYTVGGFPFSAICPVCTHDNISGGISITTDFTVPYNNFIHKFSLALLEWFLKDHATLKTGVMMLKIQLCMTGMKHILKYIEVEPNKGEVRCSFKKKKN